VPNWAKHKKHPVIRAGLNKHCSLISSEFFNYVRNITCSSQCCRANPRATGRRYGVSYLVLGRLINVTPAESIILAQLPGRLNEARRLLTRSNQLRRMQFYLPLILLERFDHDLKVGVEALALPHFIVQTHSCNGGMKQGWPPPWTYENPSSH